MSYGATAALQGAIWQVLTAAPELAGVTVVDAPPAGGAQGTFVLIGPEEVTDASDRSGAGADHRLVISVISDGRGFLTAKSVAAAISDVLDGARPELARGRLVSLQFQKAVARRLEDGDVRRVDLTFRARIEF